MMKNKQTTTTTKTAKRKQQLTYNPWLNSEDPEKCLFVSVHGYGKKDKSYENVQGGWFYPGSGETTDVPMAAVDAMEQPSSEGAGGGTGARAGEGDKKVVAPEEGGAGGRDGEVEGEREGSSASTVVNSGSSASGGSGGSGKNSGGGGGNGEVRKEK